MYNDDIKMVAEFTGDCEEDVRHYPMYKFMDSLKKAKEAEQAKKVVDMGGIERYRKFFLEYDIFCKMFGQELVDKHLVTIPFHNIAEEKAFRDDGKYNGEPTWIKEREFVTKGHRYMTIHHPQAPDYTSTRNLPAQVWRVPSGYQGTCHAKLLKAIMEEKYPWLKDFTLQLYHLEGHENANNEFYVSTDGEKTKLCKEHVPSLYVPFAAFVAGNTDAIIERNVKYITWYYKEKAGDVLQQAVYSKIPQKFLALTKENASQK